MASLRFKFYTTSGKAWAAMLAAISLAQESIYLEMYIFEGDTRGYDFLSEIERKAKEGVKVVLLLDAVGSFRLGTIEVDCLRIAGAEVLFYSHWFSRTHRKILIIDEYTVFLGGVNISHRFAPWSDLQLRLSGKRIAQSALVSFVKMYRASGGRDPWILKVRTEKPFARAKLWFIEHGLRGKRDMLKKYYMEHINNAHESIILATPYFIPRRWLIAHLHSALLRGVRVEIIIPKHTDHPIVDRVSYRYLTLFKDMGAVCLISPKMNHAKAMLIDGKDGIVGSHNLDALSFERNVEGAVFFSGKHMTGELTNIMSKWKKESQLLEDIPSYRWYDFFVTLLLPFFESVL